MAAAQKRSVDITSNGRNGQVRYTEVGGTVLFNWELGSGKVVATVRVKDALAWSGPSEWLDARRADILAYVADAMLRKKARGSVAVPDTEKGSILFRKPITPEERVAADLAWMGRARAIRLKFAMGAGLVFLIYLLVHYLFSIDPGKGTPVGASVRTGTHIATLLQTLEAYVPTPDRNAGNDRYGISLFLVPLDGSKPTNIPLVGGQGPNGAAFAKILGSDGRVLWYDVDGLGGVDLRSGTVLSEAEVRHAGKDLERVRANARGAVKPAEQLAAGYFTGPNTWLGLHSTAEAQRNFPPKSWLVRVVRAENTKEPRRFHRALMDPDTSNGHHAVRSMQAIGTEDYLNAAFLRVDEGSEPIRLTDPASALMAYTSKPGLQGTLMVARVDTAGRIGWLVDTGLERFTLKQILPGEGSVAFIGTRTAVPGKLSEPLLVLVDDKTGAITTTSLWQ